MIPLLLSTRTYSPVITVKQKCFLGANVWQGVNEPYRKVQEYSLTSHQFKKLLYRKGMISHISNSF